jgi:hypothetical protein
MIVFFTLFQLRQELLACVPGAFCRYLAAEGEGAIEVDACRGEQVFD